jgi:dTDP-4-dehydrorhamnose reductase
VKNLLVTGSKGQLGRDLLKTLSKNRNVSGFDIDEIDIRDYAKLESLIRQKKPDVVIHTAAYTDVDGCESNVETAMSINAAGTENVARACREIGARLIYYSTDYIFDGEKKTPYIESDNPNPQTVYGRSKLEGERRVIDLLDDFAILRIAWVYGLHGKNFVRTMIKIGREQIQNAGAGKLVEPIRVVNDQVGNPTWTVEIAEQTDVIIENNLIGIFHCTSEGQASWYDFARAIFEEARMKVYLVPCATEEFPRPARRPVYSVLENKALGDLSLNMMADYKAALKRFFKQCGGRENDEL